MGDKDQDVGERDAVRWKATDQPPSDEAEGHGFRGNQITDGDDLPGSAELIRRGLSPDTDEAPSDEAEGHGIRLRAGESTDQPPSEDAEGHGVRWGGAAPDTDEAPSDEAEGHIRTRS